MKKKINFFKYKAQISTNRQKSKPLYNQSRLRSASERTSSVAPTTELVGEHNIEVASQSDDASDAFHSFKIKSSEFQEAKHRIFGSLITSAKCKRQNKQFFYVENSDY